MSAKDTGQLENTSPLRSDGLRRVLLATRNAKKLTELRAIVAENAPGIEIVGLGDVPEFVELPEDGATFEENALIKARQAFAETGLPSIADDSGLAVDALNGMPGVLSARWAGRHGDDAANNALLLAQLGDVPDDRRGARFVSVCALVDDGGELTVRGEWAGTILRQPQGTNGFGYDPLFLPDASQRSSAELTPAEKNAVSHRGRALEQLVEPLQRLLQR